MLRRQFAAILQRQLHHAEKAAAGQQRARRQSAEAGQQAADKYADRLRPQRHRQPQMGGGPAAGENAQRDADHRRAAENRPDELREQAVRETRRRQLGKKGGGQNIAEPGEAVAQHQTLQIAVQHQRRGRGFRPMQLPAARQIHRNRRNE